MQNLYQVLEDRLPMARRSNTRMARAAASLFREIIICELNHSVSSTVITPQWFDKERQCFYEVVDDDLTLPETGLHPVSHVAGGPIMEVINEQLCDAFHLGNGSAALVWLEQFGVQARQFLQQYQLIDTRPHIIVTRADDEEGQGLWCEEEPYQCPNFVAIEELTAG